MLHLKFKKFEFFVGNKTYLKAIVVKYRFIGR